MQQKNKLAGDRMREPGENPAEELAWCDREIAAMLEQQEKPAWLVTLGIEDVEAEKRLIRRAVGMAVLALLLLFPARLAGQTYSLCEPVRIGLTNRLCVDPPRSDHWKLSLAVLAAGHAADAHSSWGAREANLLLAGSGRFGNRAIALKSAVAGAVALAQYLTIRVTPQDRREGLRRRYARMNFIVGGALGGLAVSNYVRRVQ